MPSRTRDFFGRLVDGFLPGQNYDRGTGQFHDIGKGLAGRGVSMLGGLVGGPAGGFLANRLVNHYLSTPGQYGLTPAGSLGGTSYTDPSFSLNGPFLNPSVNQNDNGQYQLDPASLGGNGAPDLSLYGPDLTVNMPESHNFNSGMYGTNANYGWGVAASNATPLVYGNKFRQFGPART